MLERRWHVHRLLKKLLDGRTGSKSAGTYLRHFTEAPLSCRNYNCYRHYRMRYAHDAFGGRGNPSPLSAASRVLIENVKATEKTYVSLRNAGKIWPRGRPKNRGDGGGGIARRIIGRAMRFVCETFRARDFSMIDERLRLARGS